MRSMKPIAVLIASLMLGVATASALPDVGTPEGPSMGPTDYIVGFFALPDDRATYMGEPVKAVDEDLSFFVVTAREPLFFEVRLALDTNVRYYELDSDAWTLYLDPNDPKYDEAGHYGTKVTKIEIAWDTTTGSTAVKVATVDTGLKKTHEDITGARVLQGRDTRNNDNDPNDEGGPCGFHGSHTAGTAGATINNAKGIAGVSQHSLLPIKIFKKVNNGPFGCTTTTTAIVDGLKYAGDQGAHVSSNSWGGGASSASINDAIQYAHDRGTIHVGAAGNSGPCTNCVGQPWKDMGGIAIVVSCSNANDAFCGFSSEGPQVDVAAPGNGILSVDGAGTTGYKTMSGTSMSTPHVAGVVALIEALNPGISFGDAQDRIRNSADDLGLSADRQGGGRLDGEGAIA